MSETSTGHSEKNLGPASREGKSPFARISLFVREVVSELKRVVYPSADETRRGVGEAFMAPILPPSGVRSRSTRRRVPRTLTGRRLTFVMLACASARVGASFDRRRG